MISKLRAAASETLRRWCRSRGLARSRTLSDDLRQTESSRQLLSQWQLKSLAGTGTTPAMGTWPVPGLWCWVSFVCSDPPDLGELAEDPVGEGPLSISNLSQEVRQGRSRNLFGKDTALSGSTVSLGAVPAFRGEDGEESSGEESAEEQPVTPVQWDQLMLVDHHLSGRGPSGRGS